MTTGIAYAPMRARLMTVEAPSMDVPTNSPCSKKPITYPGGCATGANACRVCSLILCLEAAFTPSTASCKSIERLLG